MPFDGSEGTLYHVLFSVLKTSEPMVWMFECVRIFDPTTISRSRVMKDGMVGEESVHAV